MTDEELIAKALIAYAAGLRRESKRRAHSGGGWALWRARQRDLASRAEQLAKGRTQWAS